MALGRNSHIDIGKHKTGLIFDADAVTLLGKYSDELSAHRAKKKWIEVFNTYFLLDSERDYEMQVHSSLSDMSFVIHCSFTSACGRYAFWRLINHQAPEAEAKLGLYTVGEDRKPSWAMNTLEDQLQKNEETKGLLNRIIKLFQ